MTDVINHLININVLKTKLISDKTSCHFFLCLKFFSGAGVYRVSGSVFALQKTIEGGRGGGPNNVYM
jgi:hypothetical protein